MDIPLYLLLSLKPTTSISATFFLLFLITPSASDLGTKIGGIAVTSAPPQLQPPVVKTATFKPSIIITVGVLTTIFALTFLLLLYAKHCRRGGVLSTDSRPPRRAELRKNSGIDRAVVESLPVFRFGSLRGHKDGLDCAVCLTRFEPTEVLRLLPKCKHAFHVECVDTWLDAHSTCPLCRYRVDPEDILLIDQPPANDVVIDVENTETDRPRRVSGRHSSALERKQPGSGNETHHTRSSLRRSFDGWTWFWKKNESTLTANGNSVSTTSADRSRKDGLLLPQDKVRLEHRIIVSSPRTSNQRWSDVESSDLLYLKSEMIMSDRETTRQINEEEEVGDESRSNGGSSGRGVIKERSVSEITGLSRFSSRGGNNSSSSSRSNNGEDQKGQPRRQKQNRERQQQRQLRLASRWKTWISSRQPPGPSAPPPPPLSSSPSSSSSASSAKGTPPRIPRPPPLPSTVV